MESVEIQTLVFFFFLFYFVKIERDLAEGSVLCKLRFKLNIIPSHAGSLEEKELWIIS